MDTCSETPRREAEQPTSAPNVEKPFPVQARHLETFPQGLLGAVNPFFRKVTQETFPVGAEFENAFSQDVLSAGALAWRGGAANSARPRARSVFR